MQHARGWRVLRLPLIVIVLLTLVPAALAAPEGPSGAAADRLRAETPAGAEITLKRATGVVSALRLTRETALALPGDTAEARAGAFFARYGGLFGIRDASGELVLRERLTDLTGAAHLTFDQNYRGVSVFGGELRIHFDAAGRLIAANGTFVPDIDLAPAAAIEPAAAAEAAIAAVTAGATRPVNGDLLAVGNELVIYRTGLMQGVPGMSHLAYQVEVTNRVDVREMVFVDAVTAAILDRFPMMDSALYRELYSPTLAPADLKWQEGAPWPTDTEYQNILNGTGETYNLLGSLTNGAWLSYDGLDVVLKSIAKYNPGGGYCPNASWNGVNTQFCNQVSGDDTVAHEWGHAYTEYTHNLIYAWQPGALNESYSDIWGEVVDLLNARGKDTPGGLRDAQGRYCSTKESFTTPDRVDDTYRWLSGEDDPAFRWPIRDMWRPECHGDPGRVLSASYTCSTSDGGGVHTNSGVPNHAFALLVDGGTYNGQTITGIGLTKAAHIYWHAQRFYQGPTTDFADHADALAASCTGLTGAPLYELKTTGPATWGATSPAITSTDCAELDKVILAVQLRTAPNCTFAPMFNPNAPALCTAAGEGPQNWLFQDFETGMTGWTTEEMPVSPATWDSRPWQVVTGAPDNRPGSVVFGPDPVVGDCNSDLDNGITSLLSPVISIPAGAAAPVRMAWDHLVSMEIDYDGGNLKASVNGGTFTLVPASAFTFNPYNSTLATTNNDNPMAGQAAWTGGDGGAVSSQWGQSQLDLSRIGVDPGDTVQFRWDVGSDGCNGWDGWYVDDVRVYSCTPCAAPAVVTGVSIAAPDASTVALQWPAAANATQYEVWAAQNEPYFDPTGLACDNPAPYSCTVTPTPTYQAANLGDTAVNHTYIVRAANACGAVSGNSAPVAEFEFELTPGSSTSLAYGWKGIADPGEVPGANASNGFWGLNPDWYYNWGAAGPWTDPAYVPMIHCTDEVGGSISPQAAADLARDHPGRAWLIFNEPDLNNDGDNCGTAINQHYPEQHYFDGSNYGGLGKYIARQYIRYHDAIKAADPAARLFAFGSFRLPGASGSTGTIAQEVWNTFASYLAAPSEEPDPTPRPLDGIAVHAYPNYSAGCASDDAACLQAALLDTHAYFQAAVPSVTAGKPIWITEIGNLQPGGSPPGSSEGRAAAQTATAATIVQPLLAWFIANAVPGGSAPYYDGLAWFATHDCRTNPDGSIKDFTTSDLLDIGPVDCPLVQQPATQQLTAIGQAWAAADCPACACPGPECP